MKSFLPYRALLFLLLSPLGIGPARETFAAPAPELQVSQNVWRGFTKQSFPLNEHAGFVVAPKTPATGKPWVWRTSFPDYHAEVDVLLLERGYHVAHLDVVSMLGADSALDHMDAFYALVRQRWGLAEKPAIEAVSRGGLPAYRYAARHPERVACIYADVPVMDLKSWPAQRADSRKQLQDALKFYGWSNEEELRAYKGNPLDLLSQIARTKIPLRHLISLNDKVVPPEENTLEAQRRLQTMGWDIELAIVQEGNKLEGHHFPMAEAEKTAAFIEKHATPRGGSTP
jgi:hypothetical protein